MKKLSFLLLFSVSFAFGQIQQDVNKNNGTTVSQFVLQIDSIRFNASQTQMEIILTNGSVESHTISEINNVTFSEYEEPSPGTIATLDCPNAVMNGFLIENTEANGVSFSVPYTGGNGEAHNGQTVVSTGATGLTATLPSGSFNNGAGTLTYSVTGTPSTSGTANFALNIGGKTCIVSLPIQPAGEPSEFTCGISTVAFTYKGGSVVYGTVEGGNNKCWLDRNLGASQVASSALDALAYGDLFQWGRGDDGHQDKNSGTTSVTSPTDNPGHSNFILNYSNWRNPKNDDLWQGVNGINNPCPDGWRVPEFSEWQTEMQSWSTGGITGGFTSPLKLTVGGWRNNGGDGSIEYSSAGFYHSSTFLNSSPANGTAMFAVESGYSGQSSNARSYGAYVRCIKD